MYTARIKTHGDSMARSMTDVRNFKVFADEPPELGGRDGAPSPLEYILVAHGTCLNYMTFFIAKELGIQVRSTEIEVEARCPVSDNITNATPVSIGLVAA